MYPNADAPLFIAGFTGTVSIIAGGILAYLTLPMWLMWEANRRKRKTGHAVPLQAMEDEENSQVSEAAQARLHQLNATAEQQAVERAERKIELVEEVWVQQMEQQTERNK